MLQPPAIDHTVSILGQCTNSVTLARMIQRCIYQNHPFYKYFWWINFIILKFWLDNNLFWPSIFFLFLTCTKACHFVCSYLRSLDVRLTISGSVVNIPSNFNLVLINTIHTFNWSKSGRMVNAQNYNKKYFEILLHNSFEILLHNHNKLKRPEVKVQNWER